MGILTNDQIKQFADSGFLIVRKLYDVGEIDLLRRVAQDDVDIDQRAFSREDGEGGSVRQAVWNHPGNGLYGMFSRGRRLVEAMETLLGGEVYHYHSKMILKDPRVGGAWAWHQDYGYWYLNGCLAPLMASAAIAVDAATKKNGCMQVLAGSHQLGRFDHALSGTQAGADPERVEEAKRRLPLIYCELDRGDALFFHSNLLHRSDQNRSEHPRWSLICCYNAARNDPYKDSHHPRYTPLEKVDDGAIKRVGMVRFADDTSEVSWVGPRDASHLREELR